MEIHVQYTPLVLSFLILNYYLYWTKFVLCGIHNALIWYQLYWTLDVLNILWWSLKAQNISSTGLYKYFYATWLCTSVCVHPIEIWIWLWLLSDYRSQIQRPATALPKSASSSSMKKTHLTTFEFEKTEMEMPKLNQFDLDELFKPVEMPKIRWVVLLCSWKNAWKLFLYNLHFLSICHTIDVLVHIMDYLEYHF